MKSKIILASVMALVLVAVLSAQIGVVKAQTVVSSAITSPITYFTLSGNVTYKLSKFLIIPANGVTITAKNSQTNQETSAKSDRLGRYSLKVAAGAYIVSAKDSKNTIFSPANKIVQVINSSISGINFQGLR